MRRWEMLVMQLAMLAVGASGALYAVMKYLLARYEPESPLGHPWQPAVLKAHVLAAPLFVFALGLLFSRHAWLRFRSGQRSGRRTGVVLLGFAVPVILSGYLVQVFVADSARAWSGWTHTVLGVILIIGHLAHPRSKTEPAADVETDMFLDVQ